MNAISVKFAIAGLLIGLAVYFGVKLVGYAAIGTQVTQKVTPEVTPKIQVTRKVTVGDTRSDTKVTVQLSPTVTMTPRPSVAVTPWPTPSVFSSLPTPKPSDVPSPTPPPSVVPSPTPWPIATPTPIPSPEPTPDPLPPTPSLSPTPAPTPRIVINEIGWMGTAASQYGEWIELYNAGENTVSLEGWKIFKGDILLIQLEQNINSGEYFLIERTTDSSPDPIPDISSDMSGKFGGSGLRNTGEDIRLVDGSGAIVDRVDCSGGWFASDKDTKLSMERRDPLMAGSDPTNWATNDGSVLVGSDAGGQPIQGTPKYRNSTATF